ncbi:MAG: hypothetical protein GVY12_12865 [Bacteroidetes bacterium]|jgi:hypothetical protein|nr:hypothetical protein [Bacteroidota bacterium]
MIFLYDNLTATVIGAMVLLIVLASTQRLNEVMVERTATYTVKSQAQQMATWLEDDLLFMGRNMSRDELAITALDTNAVGITTDFTFVYDSLQVVVDDIDTLQVQVRYELAEVGTRTLGKGTSSERVLPVYAMQRYRTVGAEPEQRDGQSNDLLSYLRIDLLDRDTKPIEDPFAVDPRDVRNTRLRFAMVTPYESDRTFLREVYYGSTLMISNADNDQLTVEESSGG